MSDGLFVMGREMAMGIGLLSVRISALLLLTPLFTAARVPVMARAVIVVGLAIAISMNMERSDWSAITASNLIPLAAAELVIGVTLGLGVAMAFAAFSIAGRILDFQIGFGLAQIFDPGSARPVSVLDSAFTRVGILVFLLLNGHHALFRAIAYSVERFPPGTPMSVLESADAVIRQAGGLFGMGFALAAPAVFCVLLVEVALGVVARNLPQMNMFVVALPVKVIVGLIVLSLWFASVGGVMSRVYGSIETGWSDLLRPPTAAATAEGR